jgi:hypothetical protein
MWVPNLCAAAPGSFSIWFSGARPRTRGLIEDGLGHIGFVICPFGEVDILTTNDTKVPTEQRLTEHIVCSNSAPPTFDMHFSQLLG